MISRPILMQSTYVKAILEDRKTQTRRIVKTQHAGCGLKMHPAVTGMTHRGGGRWGFDGSEWARQTYITTFPFGTIRCPYGEAGDQLWVRETWYWDQGDKIPAQKPKDFPVDFYYRADGDCCEQIPECECGSVGKPRWHPGIHMPRWASRITLEITGVRVERLQNISEEDAIAEGIVAADCWNPISGRREDKVLKDPVWAYSRLWESINGPGSWAANPHVWVLEFRKI